VPPLPSSAPDSASPHELPFPPPSCEPIERSHQSQ
jgi:hypothetical protein